MLDVREGGKDEREREGGGTSKIARLQNPSILSLPSSVPTLFLACHSSPLYVQRFSIKDVNGFNVCTLLTSFSCCGCCDATSSTRGIRFRFPSPSAAASVDAAAVGEGSAAAAAVGDPFAAATNFR